MDNKIILELIKKDLEEIRILIDALEQSTSNEQILIDITNSKAKTLVHEISLLKGEQKSEPFEVEMNLEEKNEVIVKETKQLIVEEISSNEETIDRIVEEIEPAVSLKNNELIELETEEEEEIIFEEVDEEEISEPENPIMDSEPELPLVEEIEVPEKETPKKEIIVREEKTEVKTEIKESKILGENFTKEPSLNERFASIKDIKANIVGKPISNLKGAIGINDKFMFSRELFDNNQEKLNAAIDAIDQAKSLINAVEYLELNFQWEKNETSLKFMELVKRRFDN